MVLEPVTVKPKVAFDALGVGVTKGYSLINSGELDAIKIGRSTRITWESVKRLVANAPRELGEGVKSPRIAEAA